MGTPHSPLKQLILLVDDHSDLRRLLGFLLENQGFRVKSAATGVEAMQAVAVELPALVLTDWMMPDMDGLALARHLRLDRRTHMIPIIMMSAVASWPAEVYEVTDAQLIKPFAIERLVDVVRQLL